MCLGGLNNSNIIYSIWNTKYLFMTVWIKLKKKTKQTFAEIQFDKIKGKKNFILTGKN